MARVPDLIAAVLGRVGVEARQAGGWPPASATLTCPASWAVPRRTVLAEAATRAGLGPVHFVAEPLAAALYYSATLRELPPAGCLIVYDLGAGTFDVSVVRRTASGFDVPATAGLSDVGGLDLDAAVVAHARELTAPANDGWARIEQPRSSADRQARQALWRGARAAKEHLSRHTSAELHVPLVDQDVRLTREEFERIARPYLERTVALTLEVVRTAKVDPAELAAVFLVGGASRIPLVATLLHRAFGVAPSVVGQPELVVAEGCLLLPERATAQDAVIPRGVRRRMSA